MDRQIHLRNIIIETSGGTSPSTGEPAVWISAKLFCRSLPRGRRYHECREDLLVLKSEWSGSELIPLRRGLGVHTLFGNAITYGTRITLDQLLDADVRFGDNRFMPAGDGYEDVALAYWDALCAYAEGDIIPMSAYFGR